MATQDLPETAGSWDAGETREKGELKVHQDFQEKLVQRPCQVPLVLVVLPAPRAEWVTQVLEGCQGCLVFLAQEGWMAFPGSLAWLEKEALLEQLVLLARLGTRARKVQTDVRGLRG